MKKTITNLITIAMLLFVLQITLTAQPIGSQIKVGIDGHISYWNGVDTWIPVAPGLPGQNLQFIAGVPSWVNNPLGITTTAITSITGTTAVSGGNILSDGGATITARGLCWSATPNPTITDAHTTDGTGIGSFVYNFTGFAMGTTYYIRAYATNSAGTAYGNEVTNTVKDFDGNQYNVVTIGTQNWLKQNLNVTHYRNGDPIPGHSNWGLTTGACCDYNNLPANGAIYGKLYNYFVVADPRNVCPVGWHVSTNDEWHALSLLLDANTQVTTQGVESYIAGGKLKEAGLTNWSSPNTDATNESGFTALPGGLCSTGGDFYVLGVQGLWHAFYNTSSTVANARAVYSVNGQLISSDDNKYYGYSIRCVKD